MSNFNTSSTHPLIPNANQYYIEKKYVSIHSEDRDILKYPNSSEFEIELPQDYLNVHSAKLSTWSFPANYNVFSPLNFNIAMTFKFIKLYNPGEHGYADPLTEAIFAGLYSLIGNQYIVRIETGFYNPSQMATELTNKFNESVSNILIDFFTNTPAYNYALALFTGYNRFSIVYNSVGQRLWFGNNADQFELTNNYINQFNDDNVGTQCIRRQQLPSLADWGLPAYLGFTRCPAPSLSAAEVEATMNNANNIIYGYNPEIINVSDRGVSGKLNYFSNNTNGVVIVDDLNKFIQVGDRLTGFTTNSRFTVTSVDVTPVKVLAIVTTTNPANADPDDEFGFSESINEWPNA